MIREDATSVLKALKDLGYDANHKTGNKISLFTKDDRVVVLQTVADQIGGKYNPKGSGSSIGRTEYGKVNILAKLPSGAGKADAKTTRMQELGSAWILRRAINDNVKYKNWESIRDDKKYHELVEIYPTIDSDDEWLQGYYAQQKRMLQEFSQHTFSEFNRDGGFMDYISELVSKKFGISKKDTWNPADIWLIKNEKAVIKIIEDTVYGSKGSQTIEELNAVLRKLYNDRKVIGVSLKKISGKVARYEEFNLSKNDLNDDYNYNTTDFVINLKWNDTKGTFMTQDSKVSVEGKGVVYIFQIKGNDSAKMSNLKWEPTQKGATAARVGKAPVDMVATLLKDNKAKFFNDHKRYPKTSKDYKKEKVKFESMFDVVQRSAKTNINSKAEFSRIISYALDTDKNNHTAVSKLMQLDFLYTILKMTKKRRNEFMTDMVFIASKKGSKFGPFGKLY
jgi:hypothetical protein